MNGNRKTETRNAGTMAYGYTGNWLLTRGSETRFKTPNGNTASTSTVGFTYDGFNRLATSQTAAETTTYTYNALGQRIRKTNQNGLATAFHYGVNGELLFEKDQSGNTREYIWIDGRPLARIDNGASIYYYHVDHLGTPQAMTDSVGATVWKADYEPFGKANVKVSTIENNLRFPGQYFDRETGLHYNYFRDYDPTIGRYLESDPTGLEGGINPYLYANAAPTMFIDPLGLTGGPPMKGTYYPRGNMPSPATPSKNDPGSWDGAVDATNGFMCALGVKSACIPNEVFICVEWECTPECGKPYRLERYSKTPSLTNPDTPCVCTRKGLNPNYDGRLPGL